MFITVAIECHPIDLIITNGYIYYAPDNSPNYALGTDAIYLCNSGYFEKFGGSQRRTCVDDDGMDAIGVFNNPYATPPFCSRRFNELIGSILRFGVFLLTCWKPI